MGLGSGMDHIQKKVKSVGIQSFVYELGLR